VYEKPRWEVTVRMDNGQPRIVSLAYEPYVQEGDRVRISGRNVELIE
jgi:outer membrane lipoprotein SlyB